MADLIGMRIKRREDPRLLTGKGTFVDDLRPLPNIQHAAVLRSPYAHARIRRVDVARALEPCQASPVSLPRKMYWPCPTRSRLGWKRR